MMNSEEALARPFSACTKRKVRSGKRWPRYCSHIRFAVIPGLVLGIQPAASAGAWGTMDPGDKHRDDTLLLARRLHLGLGEQVFRPVLVLPVLHGAHLGLQRG